MTALSNPVALLEKASNAAVIVAACTVAVTALYDRLHHPALPGVVAPGKSFAGLYKGKRIPLSGFSSGSAAATVVLFVSKNCHFCAESVPFYRRLSALRSASSAHFRLVASVPQALETEQEARHYFAEYEIGIDRAQAAPFRMIGVTATPTLALVGDNGIVTDVWTGKLTPHQEEEVVERIAAMCGEITPGAAGKR